MSRGITENDVWQAADALLLEGARPTIERVRQKIGRGSPNTVSPHLDTWFRKLGARIRDPMAFSAPPTIPDPVQQAAAHFWDTALASARAQVSSELAGERAAAEAERRAAAEEKGALTSERERLAAHAQARDDVAQALRDQLAEQQRLAGELRTRAQDQAGETAAMREAVEQHAAERDALRSKLETQRAAHEKARADIEARTSAHEKRWTMEVDRARETLKAAEAKTAKVEREAAARVDKLSRDLAQLADTHRQAVEAAARREVAQAAQIERLQSQLTTALGRLETRDKEHGALLRSLVGRGKGATTPARETKRRASPARR